MSRWRPLWAWSVVCGLAMMVWSGCASEYRLRTLYGQLPEQAASAAPPAPQPVYAAASNPQAQVREVPEPFSVPLAAAVPVTTAPAPPPALARQRLPVEQPPPAVEPKPEEEPSPPPQEPTPTAEPSPAPPPLPLPPPPAQVTTPVKNEPNPQPPSDPQSSPDPVIPDGPGAQLLSALVASGAALDTTLLRLDELREPGEDTSSRAVFRLVSEARSAAADLAAKLDALPVQARSYFGNDEEKQRAGNGVEARQLRYNFNRAYASARSVAVETETRLSGMDAELRRAAEGSVTDADAAIRRVLSDHAAQLKRLSRLTSEAGKKVREVEAELRTRLIELAATQGK